MPRTIMALADQAKAEAARLKVPLIATGQSQAGGTAQVQVAHLLKAEPNKISVGFVTFNATCSTASIRYFGLDPARLPGVNFAKDLDPLGAEVRIPNAPRDSVFPGAAFGPGGDLGVLFRDDRESGKQNIYFSRLGCTPVGP